MCVGKGLRDDGANRSGDSGQVSSPVPPQSSSDGSLTLLTVGAIAAIIGEVGREDGVVTTLLVSPQSSSDVSLMSSVGDGGESPTVSLMVSRVGDIDASVGEAGGEAAVV